MSSFRKFRYRSTMSALGFSSLLLLTGCTSTVDDESRSEDDARLAFSEDGNSRNVPTPGVSPIDDYLGIEVLGEYGPQLGPWAAYKRSIEPEETLAACMNDNGFEFTSMIDSATRSFGAAYLSREWVEKYGFGVSTRAFKQSEVGPDLVAADGSAVIFNHRERAAVGPHLPDPNEAYVYTLDDDQKKAYQIALHGDPALEESSEDEAQEQPWPGCQNVAFESYNIGRKFNTAFIWELTGLTLEAMGDQRMQSKVDAVDICVAKAGHELTRDWGFDVSEETNLFDIPEYAAEVVDIRGMVSPQQSSEEDALWEEVAAMEDEVDELYDTYDELADDPSTTDDRLDALDEEIEALEDEIDGMHENFENLSELEGSDTLGAEARAELAALQQKEVATALAAFDCGGSIEEMAALHREIMRDYEEDFIAEHKEKLDLYKADPASFEGKEPVTPTLEELEEQMEIDRDDGFATNFSEIGSSIRG